ncbi:MAG: TetR/AcrR family transcriptional regulator [Maritimibacter sp.]
MNEIKPLPRRGRPRKFDRDEALRQAMEVFWTNGYDGTSVAQLVEVMGIVSPSIYAAFGSKEELFREAVELYIEAEFGPIWAALYDVDDPREALLKMFFASIDKLVSGGTQRGCLIMLGTGLLGGGDPKVRAFLQQKRAEGIPKLADWLKQAMAAGHLAPDTDPVMLARVIMAYFGGLNIEAADGADNASLKRSAELFCARIMG